MEAASTPLTSATDRWAAHLDRRQPTRSSTSCWKRVSSRALWRRTPSSPGSAWKAGCESLGPQHRLPMPPRLPPPLDRPVRHQVLPPLLEMAAPKAESHVAWATGLGRPAANPAAATGPHCWVTLAACAPPSPKARRPCPLHPPPLILLLQAKHQALLVQLLLRLSQRSSSSIPWRTQSIHQSRERASSPALISCRSRLFFHLRPRWALPASGDLTLLPFHLRPRCCTNCHVPKNKTKNRPRGSLAPPRGSLAPCFTCPAPWFTCGSLTAILQDSPNSFGGFSVILRDYPGYPAG